jgi:hypothetical protein
LSAPAVCTRCGGRIGPYAFPVPTVDGDRHEVCPEPTSARAITVSYRRVEPESPELRAAVALFKANLGARKGPQRARPRILTFFGIVDGRGVSVRYESTLNRPARVYRRETTILLEAEELEVAQRFIVSQERTS